MDYIPEKELLFENTHLRDKAFYREFFFHTMIKNPVLIIASIVAVLAGGINIVLGLLDAALLDVLVFGVLPIAVVALLALTYFLNVRRMTAREAELSPDGQPIYTTRVYYDKLVIITKHGAEVSVGYDKIKTVKVTTDYLLLGTPTKQFFPIKKDGFAVGDYEAFCAFLRAKNFKIK